MFSLPIFSYIELILKCIIRFKFNGFINYQAIYIRKIIKGERTNTTCITYFTLPGVG